MNIPTTRFELISVRNCSKWCRQTKRDRANILPNYDVSSFQFSIEKRKTNYLSFHVSCNPLEYLKIPET